MRGACPVPSSPPVITQSNSRVLTISTNNQAQTEQREITQRSTADSRCARKHSRAAENRETKENMLAIAKRERTAKEKHADYVTAMWVLFLQTPAQPQPDVDGMFSLGEIGTTRSDRGVDRPTPYSPGRVR